MSRRWTIALDLRWSALICLCCAATCIADSKASPISASSFALKYEGYNEAARELQDIFANEHVQQLLRDHLVIEELPVLKLVVIGDQSAGKSTLIQRITRVPMYRGTGTKTRCPLEVRMLSGDKSKGRTYSIKTKAHDGSSEERVLKVFTNVEDAGRHVQEAQDHVLGGKDFSKTPIIIEVHNAGFSLTLVDLPGFIVQDTNNVISNMASDYMLQPGTLILAVVQAINENELIHSLNLIRKTKGTCSNCMAVLTKLRSGQELQIDSWADAFSGKGPWKDVIAKDSWFAMEIRQNDTLSNYDDTDAWERQFFHGHHITTLSSRNSTGLGALHAEVDRRLAQLTASVLQQSYKTATHLLRLIKAAQNPEGNQEPTDDAQKHINKLLSTTAEAVRWTVARASAHDDPCPSLTRPPTVTNWKVHENKIYARFLAEVQKYSPGNCFLTETEETGAAEPAELTFELIARKPTKKALKVGLGMMIEDPPVDGGEMRSLWLRLASMWVDKLWPVHVRKCLEDMTEHLKAVLHDKWQHKVCGRYPVLERKISAYLDDFITDLYTGTEKALALLNARETFTVTGPIAETYTLFKDEFRNTRGNILRAANKTDPNVDPRVMEEFVDLQTWYEVLHRRYADAVVLTIRYDLVRKSLDFADYCMDRLKTEARQEYKTAVNPVHELPEQTDDARLHDLTKLTRIIAGRLTEQGAQALPHYAPALLDAAESTDAERRSSLLKAQQQLEVTVEKLATLVK